MYTFPFFRSLKYRIAFFIGTMVVIAMISFSLLVREVVRPALYRVLEESAKAFTMLLEPIIVNEMFHESPHNIQRYLSEMASLQDSDSMVKLRVVDEFRKVHFSSLPEEVGITLSGEQQKTWFFTYENKPAINYVQPIKARTKCLTCHSRNKKEIGFFNIVLSSSQLPVEKELSHRRILYLSLLIASSLFLALWFYISHQVTSPLGKLSRHMQRVEKGELDLDLDFDTKGSEIDKLKECFSHMLRSLKYYRQDLEDKIKLRTKELADVNLQLNKKISELDMIKSFNENIIQSLQGGLITIDAVGKISFVNRKAVDLLGFQEDEILSQGAEYLLCTKHEAECDFKKGFQHNGIFTFASKAKQKENPFSCAYQQSSCLLRDVLDSKKETEGEMEITRKDGSKFPAHVSLSTLVDNSGSQLGITVIIRDLTKEKDLETSMKQMDRLTILGKLMASLAHEIKNPLAGIQAAMEVLNKYYEDGDFRKEISEEILNQVKRLDKVIMDLLKFSKIRRPDFQLVKIEEIIDISLFLVNNQIKEKGVVLKKEIVPDLPPVLADAEQLQQVLLNLLLNAIQAMPDGGTITVKGEALQSDKENKDSSFIKVVVQDNGIGIPDENISKIFDPFFTSKPKGTGLGLSIVQNIVAQHKGKIEVRSQVKLGTTVAISLPAGEKTTLSDV